MSNLCVVHHTETNHPPVKYSANEYDSIVKEDIIKPVRPK